MTNINTKIEWTDVTWSPVTGCTKVSAGCKNCYAEKVADRFWGDRKFTDVRTHWDRLGVPLRWRKPRRVFVNSMSDLFHDDVPLSFIDQVFAVMALAPRHTFQILTKRPERMRAYFEGLRKTSPQDRLDEAAVAMGLNDEAQCQITNALNGVLGDGHNVGWPMRNVWLGVSCENQETAEQRIPLLLQTPAAVRFVSCEPLLGPVRLDSLRDDEVGARWTAFRPRGMREPCDTLGIDWVIVGGESGPGARSGDVAWIRSIVEQCKSAGVACFVKQLGAQPVARDRWDMSEQVFAVYDALGWSEHGGAMVVQLRDRKGGDPSEWPEDLRVREFPAARGAR